ncbi:Trehalose-6-phosphate hydrolase [Lacticaseibacillus paracasei]|nr:Trehalose-6-phosphate hydrolase [Lacticaseibacillus paracasei]
MIGKAEKLVDAPPEVASKTLYTDTPIVQDYLKELAANSFGQDQNSVTVGEMSSTTVKNSIAYTKPENHELSMVFQFHHLKTDYKNGEKWTKEPYNFNALRDILHTWGQQLNQGGGWQALFWNNHDQPRALNRFGNVDKYRVKSAEMLAAAIHLSRGTPYIYMGEEIGMTDPHYHSMADYVDIEAKNAYKALLKEGKSEKAAFAIILAKARDNSRTPMQWDDSANAGFTTGTPWLRPTNQKEINVKDELAHGEIFQFYQKLIALRKQYDVISDGSYEPFGIDIDRLYAYERVAGEDHLLVLNNFSDKAITVPLPNRFQSAKVLITNESGLIPTATMTLPPYATIALLTSEEN